MIRIVTLILAATWLSQVLAQTPSPREAFDNGDFATALQLASELLEKQSDEEATREIQLIRARALAETGQLVNAAAAFSALAPSPDDVDIQYAIARAQFDLIFTDPAAARNAMERAITRFSDDGIESASAAQLIAAAAALKELARDDPDMNDRALELLERAVSLNPDDPAPHVAIGDLLLSRYNNTEALEAYRDALKRDDLYPSALLGLAHSQYFDRSAAAREAVERTLEVRPDDTAAQLLLARLHIDFEDYESAAGVLGKLLERNPKSPAALTLVASIQFLQGDVEAARQTRQHIRRFAPGYVDMYITLSEIVGQNRHYREAARLALMGANMDERAWRAHALLGINRLRLGDESSARNSLELAFRGDPYDVRTRNTLDLMDRMESFFRVGSDQFMLVADPGEARVLAPRLFPLVKRAWTRFVDRYGIRPRTPVRIEMFPRHEDFSVRTVGLVGVDIVGVAFGSVIAMDSPSSDAFGDFNWASVLWHELSHTFHLALSRGRVPRWFTEGLSVYEERRGGPGWGDDVSASFLEALSRGRLNPPSRLNESFLRPSYPQQVIHAYYQGYLLMEMIAQDHGDHVFRNMLIAYGRGESTAEILQSELGLSFDELDTRFDSFVNERYKDAIAALDEDTDENYPALMRAAREAITSEQFDLAIEKLLAAQAVFPYDGGPRSSYRLLADVYLEQDQRDLAIEQLEKSLNIDADDFEAYLLLAKLYREAGSNTRAIDTYEAALDVNPFVESIYTSLAELQSERKAWTKVAQARAAIVSLEPGDPIAARYELARALTRAERPDEARKQILATLEQAPLYDDALELLLEIRATGTAPTTEEMQREQ